LARILRTPGNAWSFDFLAAKSAKSRENANSRPVREKIQLPSITINPLNVPV
jgi:hypothetical protein